MRQTIQFVLTMSGAFTLGIMICAVQPWSQREIDLVMRIFFILGFGALSIVPHVRLNRKVGKAVDSPKMLIVLFIGACIMLSFTVFCLIEFFVFRADGIGLGLMITMLPFLQCLVGTITVGVAGSRWIENK